MVHKLIINYGIKMILILFLGTSWCQGQNRAEREYRIRKSQFPTVQAEHMTKGSKIKKKRYYKEVNGLQTIYKIKFKRDRLHYFISYDDTGKLINSGFRVAEIDVPDETLQKIKSYLSDTFETFRIQRIFQEYPVTDSENDTLELTDTFQNLLLPSNVYRLIINAKSETENVEYDLWFNSDGSLLNKRRALPRNNDRILY